MSSIYIRIDVLLIVHVSAEETWSSKVIGFQYAPENIQGAFQVDLSGHYDAVSTKKIASCQTDANDPVTK